MKRISKAAARKMWENNQDFIMVPCKLSPAGLGAIYTRCDLSAGQEDYTFEQLINAFTYYNCNKETGEYIAFYIEE